MAIPLQVKAAKNTLGVILPIPDPDKMPQRLKLVKGMLQKIKEHLYGKKKIKEGKVRHTKGHEHIKAILFVKCIPIKSDFKEEHEEDNLQEIKSEIEAIVRILINHTHYNSKKVFNIFNNNY